MTNILFVCSANIDRSPTAEHIYANQTGLEVKSAGVGWYAQQPVTTELLQWADVVLCMEEEHKNYIVKDLFPVCSLPELITDGAAKICAISPFMVFFIPQAVLSLQTI